MPDKVRNSQVRRGRPASAPAGTTAKAMAQVKTSTTVVRIAVARFESISPTPTLASTAVSPANTADRSAQTNQFMADFSWSKKDKLNSGEPSAHAAGGVTFPACCRGGNG